jgi:hypothetical protein
MTKALEYDDAIRLRDCDRSGGKGALCDRIAEDGEGRGKGFVLIFEGWDERWKRSVQGLDARENS